MRETIKILPNIDNVLSMWGGLVRGSMVEIYGPEGGGKTTFALLCEKAAQKAGLKVGHIDVEFSLVDERATELGVDLEKLDWRKPESGEEALSAAVKMAQDGYGLIVIDSVAGLVPKSQLETLQDKIQDDEFGESGGQYAPVAGILARTLAILRQKISLSKTSVILINQIRANFQKFGMGPETDSFGGYAIKHYVDSRFELRRVSWIKYSNKVIGFRAKIRAPHKNRFAIPNREGFFNVAFDDAFKYVGTLENMVEMGQVESKGGFYLVDGCKFRGNKVPEEIIKIIGG